MCAVLPVVRWRHVCSESSGLVGTCVQCFQSSGGDMCTVSPVVWWGHVCSESSGLVGTCVQ